MCRFKNSFHVLILLPSTIWFSLQDVDPRHLSEDSFYLINHLTNPESETSLCCHNNMINVHHLSVIARIENLHLDMEVGKPLNHRGEYSAGRPY